MSYTQNFYPVMEYTAKRELIIVTADTDKMPKLLLDKVVNSWIVAVV